MISIVVLENTNRKKGNRLRESFGFKRLLGSLKAIIGKLVRVWNRGGGFPSAVFSKVLVHAEMVYRSKANVMACGSGVTTCTSQERSLEIAFAEPPHPFILRQKFRKEYFRLFYVRGDNDVKLIGLRWRCESDGDKPLLMEAKKMGARWNGRFWIFGSSKMAEEFFHRAHKSRPDWPVVSNRDITSTFSSTVFAGLERLNGELSVLIISFPFSPAAELPGMDFETLFCPASILCVLRSMDERRWLLAAGNMRDIRQIRSILVEGGAKEGEEPRKLVQQLSYGTKVLVKASGCSVELGFCVLDLKHHQLVRARHHFQGRMWRGAIQTSQDQWPAWRDDLERAGVDWVVDGAWAEIAGTATQARRGE